MSLLEKNIAYLRVFFPSAIIITLVAIVTGKPSNEISWVKWKTVWEDYKTSLVPVGTDYRKYIFDDVHDGFPHDQYLARLHINNNTYPGKWHPDYQKWSIWWNMDGKRYVMEHESRFEQNNVEFLKFPKGALDWVLVRKSHVPKEDMVPVGKVDGETIYCCRAYGKTDLPVNVITGIYKHSTGTCCYPGSGRGNSYVVKVGTEICTKEYEVLVLSPYGRLIGGVLPPVK